MVINMNIPTRRELLKAGLAIAGGNLSLGLPGALYAYAAPIGADTNGQRFYSGALPARSDVVMSTRSFHPDALNQLKAFQATRNEWFYTTDAAYFAEMKKLVKHVGLSTSTTTRHPNMPTPNDLRANRFAPQASGVSRDIDGSVTVAPWMVTSETAWNSMFNADTRAAIMASVKVAVGIGADSLQVDDPAMEYAVTQWAGGDFSPEALSAFRAYCQSSPAARGLRDLAAVDFDMSRWVKSRAGTATHINWGEFKKVHGSDPAWLVWTTFMKITTQNFISSIRQYLYSQPRPLPISLNALPVPTANETYLLDCADYLISEIYHLLWPRQLAAYHACCHFCPASFQ